MNPNHKQLAFSIFETGLRIWTACYVIIYGVAKSFQFQGAKLMEVSIKEASNAEMMWAFFGTTQAYPVIIGVLQVIGAILLIINRTKLIGALLLTPIFINIILLDVLYQIHLGALINAIIYQCVFIFIFIQQRARLKVILHKLIINRISEPKIENRLINYAVGFAVAIILFMAYQLLMSQF